jgi:TRAP-type C4-dicarboxylate transport system permease small subunit
VISLDRLDHRAIIATHRIALVGFTGLVMIALLTFYDGAARYLDLPRISGFADVGELLFPIIIASCFPALLIRQKNLTIRVLGRVAGDATVRYADLAAAVAVLIFFTLLGLQFVQMTLDFHAARRTTATIEIPTAVFWMIATSILWLCVPIQLLVVLSRVRDLSPSRGSHD